MSESRIERLRKVFKRACPDDHECNKCGAVEAECFDLDNDYDDVRYACRACGHERVFEGPDS